jgi:uncharacterized phage protein (TIGR01671 family)
MRTIKFRAWDKKNKQFWYQFKISSLYGSLYFPDDMIREDWELLQFTGLLDKNGKEIYEGDIVKITDPYDEESKISLVKCIGDGFIVEWNNGFCGGDSDISLISWAMEDDFKFEVIGNIYENPELLKQ